MKEAGLRIGNFINYEQTTHVLQELDESTCASTWLKGEANVIYHHDYDAIKPIILTEEWLIDFGFSVKMGSVTHNHSFIKGSVIISNPLRSCMYYDSTKLEYVHSLQNLYFALTGEEL